MTKAKTTTKDKAKRPAAAKTTTTRKAEAKTESRSASATVSSRASRTNLRQELVLGSLFGELVGTFALVGFLLGFMTVAQTTSPLYALFAVIPIYYVFMRLSGSHLNPALTIGLLAVRKVTWVRAVGYVVAQFLGAMLAYVIVSQFIHSAPVDTANGQTAPILYHINLVANDHWRPFFGEALGTMLLSLGFAMAIFNRKSELESSVAIGGMYYVGLMLATLGSAAVINPAVGLAVQAFSFDNWWTILQYGLGPVVGAIAGFWLYKLLQWDVLGGKNGDA